MTFATLTTFFGPFIGVSLSLMAVCGVAMFFLL